MKPLNFHSVLRPAPLLSYSQLDAKKNSRLIQGHLNGPVKCHFLTPSHPEISRTQITLFLIKLFSEILRLNKYRIDTGLIHSDLIGANMTQIFKFYRVWSQKGNPKKYEISPYFGLVYIYYAINKVFKS